jgi:lysophospholipase L1-like esterase
MIALALLLLELPSWCVWEFYVSKKESPGVIAVFKVLEGDAAIKRRPLMSHPYSLYWNTPEFADEWGQQFDSYGYRSPEFDPNQHVYKILAMGGSTTVSYPFVKDRAKIWTTRLHHKIAAAGIPNHVFNAGLKNGTSAELLAHYFLRAQHLHPDLLILHVGGNDRWLLMADNYKTDYSHARASLAGYTRPRPLESTLIRYSYFYRNLFAMWLRDGGLYNDHVGQEQPLRADAAMKNLEKAKPVAFRSNLGAIIRHAQQQGTKVILVGFIEAPNDQLANKHPALQGWEGIYKKALAMNYAAMQSLADQYNVPFLRLDENRFQLDWFMDFCHLYPEGHAEKARQIYHALQQNDLLPSP